MLHYATTNQTYRKLLLYIRGLKQGRMDKGGVGAATCFRFRALTCQSIRT